MHKQFIKTIYLDMDGVIADFEKRYKEMFETMPSRDDKSNKFNRNFDKFIESKQFATLEMMPDAEHLISFLKGIDVPTKILSSTASEKRHDAIAPQKEQWLNEHDIKFERIFVPGKQLKYKYADSESLIIDDTVSVIDDWRRNGGHAIWHNNVPATLAMLKLYV
jgi:hypothetical protein